MTFEQKAFIPKPPARVKAKSYRQVGKYKVQYKSAAQ